MTKKADTPMTVAELLSQVDDSAPQDDHEVIKSALAKADKAPQGPLANVLHSLFFHTSARIDPEVDDGSAYREMPLNQIVALADWYLAQADEDLAAFAPRLAPDGVDKVALAHFVEYRITRDLLSDVFEQARVSLGFGLKLACEMRPDEQALLTKTIRLLIAEEPDGAKLLAIMAADEIANAVIAAADEREAADSANVTRLDDRR
jgi:hypothetical protein